jgi:DNA-binding NarL/FixJ family response regulator
MATADPAVVGLLGGHEPEIAPLLDRLAELNPPHPFRLVPAPAKLTPREQLLLEKLAGGGAILQIAQELHVSPATIRNQRKSLYRKLGAASRRHAVEIGLRTGLLATIDASIDED